MAQYLQIYLRPQLLPHKLVHIDPLEPGMLQNLVRSTLTADSLVSIFAEKPIDQVNELGGVGGARLAGKIELTVQNGLVLERLPFVVERRIAELHLVHHDAHSPPVS